MKKRAAIYARVSTGEQSSENQLRALKAVAERAGWDVVGISPWNGSWVGL